MSDDLSKVPTADLRAEVQRREQEAKNQRNEKLGLHQALVVAHVANLLALVPDHERTSCSDDNPCNASSGRNPRCTRCQLLRIQKDVYNDWFVAKITLEYQPPEE